MSQHPLIHTAIKAARKAGDIMLQSLDRLDTINPTNKGYRDFVTDVDKRAEKEIIYLIKKAYPDHGIIAEESGNYQSDSESVWIIDPLDGTRNYMHGIPHFSVSIGFKFKGRLEQGVVYDPIRQEMFSASRGQGARLNDRRIRVSETMHLDKALIGTGFPVHQPKDLLTYLDQVKALFPQVANMRCSGSAALDLCYVAAARLDGFLEMNLHAWDLAAGAIIVKEAGGLVGDWQGAEDYLEKGAIVAATPKIFSALLKNIVRPQTVPSSNIST